MDLLNNVASTYLQMRQLANDPTTHQTNLTKILQPEKPCGSRRAPEDYDLSLHIGALFLLWITSSAAAYSPLLLRRLIEEKRSLNRTAEEAEGILNWTLWSARYFGTGVIIGTAFVHLLPAAQEALTDPCLPEFYTETYTAFPEAIAMIAFFMIFLVDIYSRRYVDYLRSCEQTLVDAEAEGHDARSEQESATDLRSLHRHNSVYLRERAHTLDQASIQSDLAGEQLHIIDSNLNPAHEHYCHEQNEKAKDAVSEYGSSVNINKSRIEPQSSDVEAETRHAQRQEFLSILVVEAGIIFHSIFIGLTLAITSGEEFTALLISICFHQTFEGLAIGGRLANLSRDSISWKDWKLWLSATMYGMTTPFGIAIGIAVRQDYDLSSPSSLILSGVFDSLSSGLLLYGGLVGLLSRDFTGLLEKWAEGTLGPYGARICGAAVFLVALGCMAMGILGRYA